MRILKFTERIVLTLILALLVLLKAGEIFLEFYLFDLLAKEVNVPTGCKLEADVWDLSIFRLSGIGEKVNIVCEKDKVVTVEKIQAEFSLREIFKKKVNLNLILFDAYSDGFWEDTVLYKFIDYLALEPEREPFIRLTLKKMSIFGIKSEGDFEGFKVKAYGNLEYNRTWDDTIGLIVDIKDAVINKFRTSNLNLRFSISDIVQLKEILGSIESFLISGSGFFNSTKSLNLAMVNELNNLLITWEKDEKSRLRISAEGEEFELSGIQIKDYSSKVALQDLSLFDGELDDLESGVPFFYNLMLSSDIDFYAKEIKFLDISFYDLKFELHEKKAFFEANNIDFSGYNIGCVRFEVEQDKNVLVFSVFEPFEAVIRLFVPDRSFFIEKIRYDFFEAYETSGKIKVNSILGKTRFFNSVYEFSISKPLFYLKELQGKVLVEYNNALNISLKDYEFDINCARLSVHASLKSGFLDIQNLKVQTNCYGFSGWFLLEGIKTSANRINVNSNIKSSMGDISLLVHGNFENLSFKLFGDINFTPVNFTDFHYSAPSKLELSGSLNRFKLRKLDGRIDITDGTIIHTSNLISVKRINAEADFDSQGFYLRKFTGQVNDGEFSLHGMFRSSNDKFLKGEFKDVKLRYLDNLDALFSGDFDYKDTLKVNLLATKLDLKVPETSLIFSLFERTKSQRFDDFLQILKTIDVDLGFQSIGGVNLEIPGLSTRLLGFIRLKNTNGQISSEGSLSLVGGFISISANLFEIRRGRVYFNSSLIPQVDITASRIFYYSRLFPVEIFINLKGDAFEPRANLFSSSELTQDEIQKIIFTRDPAFYNFSPKGVTLLQESDIPLKVLPDFLVKNFLPGTISLDFIPQEGDQTVYSLQFGKQMTERIKLLAETTFYENYSTNKIRLKFSPLERFTLLGEVSNNPLLAQTGFSGDVLYSAIDSSLDSIFSFKGNKHFSASALRAYIPKVSILNISLLSTLTKMLEFYYKNSGFLHARVEALCLKKIDDFCMKVQFQIFEGPRYVLRRVYSNIEGPKFESLPATDENIGSILSKLKRSQIREGFFIGDLSVRKNCHDINSTLVECDLIIHVGVRRNIKIVSKNSSDIEFFISLFENIDDPLNLSESFYLNFSRNISLKTGRLIKVRIVDQGSITFFEIQSSPLQIDVDVDGVVRESFQSKALSEVLSSLTEILRDKNLVLQKYQINWSESGEVKLIASASSLNQSVEADSNSLSGSDTVVANQDLRDTKFEKEYEVDLDKNFEVNLNSDKNQPKIFGRSKQISDITIFNFDGKVPRYIRKLARSFIGKTADDQTISELINSIEKLKVFKIVDYSLDKEEGSLKLYLRRMPYRSLNLGGGYHSELGWHLFAIGSDQSLFVSGQQLYGKMDIYLKEDFSELNLGAVSISYRDPLINFERYTFESDLGFQRTKQSELPFSLERSKMSLNLNWLGPVYLKSKFGVVSDSVFDVKPDITSGTNDVSLVFLGLEGRITELDNFVLPRSGYNLFGEIKFGFLDFNHFEFKLGNSYHFSFLDDFSIYLSGKLSQIVSDEVVPISYRYFSGGRDTIRGYKLFKLGKKGAEGNPVGGKRLVLTRSELSLTKFEPIIGSLFLDAGFLDNKTRESTGVGIGFGLRYATPVGPVGVEFARGIYDNSASRDFAFYLSVGVNF